MSEQIELERDIVIPESKEIINVDHYTRDVGDRTTVHLKKVECNSYDIKVHNCSTLIIDELICLGDGNVEVASWSTLKFMNLDQKGICKLYTHNMSTFVIREGTLKTCDGFVKSASTGICKADCQEPNSVKISGSSTWIGC